MRCPHKIGGISIQQKNPVKMVWHNHDFVDFDIVETSLEVIPSVENSATSRIRAHHIVFDVAAKTCAMLNTDRYAIGARLRIIVLTQAQRSSTKI